MDCRESIQAAVKYESESLWKNARDCYFDLLVTDLSPERKDFYYDSYFKCFANLGEWEKIPNTISSLVEGNSTWESLWDGEWNQRKLLPWYISAQVKNGLFEQNLSEEFFKNINSCLSDDSKGEYLKINNSEELCMMALFQKDIPLATVYLKSYIKYFLEDWQLINPMFQSLRYQKLLKLHSLIETDELLSIYKNLFEDFEVSIPKISSKWQNLSKELLPSVMMNETRHLYRSQFVNILLERLSTFSEMDYRQYEKILKTVKNEMDINLITIAAESNNFYVARKYYRPYVNNYNIKLKMAFGKIALAKSKMMICPTEELNANLEAQMVFCKLEIILLFNMLFHNL